MSNAYIRRVSHRLGKHVIVWWVDLDEHAKCVPMEGLEPDERVRGAGMSVGHAGTGYLASRHALRALLARALGTRVQDVRLQHDPHGRLRLKGAELQFSLSRSEGEGLIGVSARDLIGVDIETVRRIPAVSALAAEHLTPSEQSYVNDGPSAGYDRRFLRCWTRKEAVLKALGVGLRIAPATFDVDPTDRGRPVSILLGGQEISVHISSFEPSASTVGSVALAGGEAAALAVRALRRL